MQKFMDAVRRYSGYARFVEPVWSFYIGWIVAHPKAAGVTILVLALTQFA
jgi:hypothetical protein